MNTTKIYKWILISLDKEKSVYDKPRPVLTVDPVWPIHIGSLGLWSNLINSEPRLLHPDC